MLSTQDSTEHKKLKKKRLEHMKRGTQTHVSPLLVVAQRRPQQVSASPRIPPALEAGQDRLRHGQAHVIWRVPLRSTRTRARGHEDRQRNGVGFGEEMARGRWRRPRWRVTYEQADCHREECVKKGTPPCREFCPSASHRSPPSLADSTRHPVCLHT